LLVRLSRNTFEAADAAFDDVTFFGAFVCDSALPPAVLDFLPVLELRSVFEALDAAFGLVTFNLAIFISPYSSGGPILTHSHPGFCVGGSGLSPGSIVTRRGFSTPASQGQLSRYTPGLAGISPGFCESSIFNSSL